MKKNANLNKHTYDIAWSDTYVYAGADTYTPTKIDSTVHAEQLHH